MNCQSPVCFIPNFVEIGLLVLGKKFLKGVLPAIGHGRHIGHVTSIKVINFHFLVPKSLHAKIGGGSGLRLNDGFDVRL